jgi:hypothetical protein
LYDSDLDFIVTYKTLRVGKIVSYFHLQDELLCYMGHLCVPLGEHEKLILRPLQWGGRELQHGEHNGSTTKLLLLTKDMIGH